LELGNLHAALRPFWYPVALAREVHSQPLRIRLLGETYALARLGGQVVAFRDRCPHRGAPLSEGRAVNDTIQCAYHGYRFDADGRCVEIPNCDRPIPARARLDAPWGVIERYGVVWLAPTEPRSSLPELPEWGNPSWRTTCVGPLPWRASAGQMIDNFVDTSHFAFVHGESFAIPTPASSGQNDIGEVRRCGLSFSFAYEHIGRKVTADDRAGEEKCTQRAPALRRRLRYTYWAPFCLRIDITYPERSTADIVFVAIQPVDAESSGFFKILMSTGTASETTLELEREYQRKITGEDQHIVESLSTKALSLDLDSEVHTHLDAAAVMLRRILRDVQQGDPESQERGQP
jgi:phenylpropionate dioxygenase-like ring-hydroxylating dioxygenase large terminal subunit